MIIQCVKGKYYQVVKAQGGGKSFLSKLDARTMAEARVIVKEQQKKNSAAIKKQRLELPLKQRKELWRKISLFRRSEVKSCCRLNRIAFFTDAPENFTGKNRDNPTAQLFDACGIPFETISTEDVALGKLKEYDAIFCPGGFGYLPDKIVSRNLKEFIFNGGGYIGFCAGAFLPLSRYLNILDADYDYFREGGFPMVHLNPVDPIAFGTESTTSEPVYALYKQPACKRRYTRHIQMMRHNGPLILARGKTCVVGYFDGTLPHAAIVRGRYGTGRIVVNSVHPDCNMCRILEDTSEQNLLQNTRIFINTVLHVVRHQDKKCNKYL